MNAQGNPDLTPHARELRKNMTKEEQRLWYCFLRHLSVRVKRQRVIGNYIVDFYCDCARIAIELDGSQHYEPEAAEYDRKRDAYLKGLGLEVLRYTNLDVSRNYEGVCLDILKHLEERSGKKIVVKA